MINAVHYVHNLWGRAFYMCVHIGYNALARPELTEAELVSSAAQCEFKEFCGVAYREFEDAMLEIGIFHLPPN